MQAELQVLLGFEVDAYFALEGEGFSLPTGGGLIVAPAGRVGLMIAGGYSFAGMLNWEASKLEELAGGGFGVGVGVGPLSVAFPVSIQEKNSCEPGITDEQYLNGIQVSAVGPDVALGITSSFGYSSVWRWW